MAADYDCAIIGAGMVGASAAVALARRGLAVALLERRAAPSSQAIAADVRALVLSAASVEILSAAGLWTALALQAEAITDIHVHERGQFGAVRLNARSAGLAALGWACPADGLLASVQSAAEHCAGVSAHWGAHYTGHRVADDEVRITFEQDGTQGSLPARLLSAADGADSAVRDTAGIALDVHDYAQDAIVANLVVSRPQAHTAFERFTMRGPLALIPRGGARYVAVQCLDRDGAESAVALSDSDYLTLLERRFGLRLGRLSQLGARHRHRLIRREAARLTAPRLALAGNAARTVHPNAAQGLNLGLRDVAALVALLGPGVDGGSGAVLARYAASRADDQSRTVGFTDALAQGFISRSPLVACARRAALTAAAHLPGLRRRLVVEASGLAALRRIENA